jgi:preprotein translocase subunit SecE
MSEKKDTSPTLKRSWFQGLKAEFGKITWPDRKATLKQSVAVVIISVLVGALIAVLDLGVTRGVKAVVNIGVEQTNDGL